MTRENNRSVVAGGNVAINDIIYRAFHRYFPENGEETEMEFLSFAREGTTTDRPRGGDEKKKKKTKEHSRRTLVRDHRSIVEKKNQRISRDKRFSLLLLKNERIDPLKEGVFSLLLFNGSEFMDETSYFSGPFPAADERLRNGSPVRHGEALMHSLLERLFLFFSFLSFSFPFDSNAD